MLGLSKIKILLKVSLPMARPAIIGGILLVTMEVVADFGVSDHFGISTITTGIFRTWLLLGDKISALQLSASLFIFILFLILLEKSTRKGKVLNPDNNLLKNDQTVAVFGSNNDVSSNSINSIVVGKSNREKTIF